MGGVFRYYIYAIIGKTAFLWPDEMYLKIVFRLRMGYRLNLKKPQTFSEKLQWLKIHNRRLEYTKMVDKVAAKDYVANIIGNEHIIPTIAVYDKVEDIDWSKLPNQFVLKCAHDSGGIVICKDKRTLDISSAKAKLSRGLKQSYYKVNREYPYKNVPKRIICEEYMVDESGYELKDYKFFCFNGEVKFLKVDFNRFSGHHANYFDTKWNLLDFGELALMPDKNKKLDRPKELDEMIALAKKLSSGIPFLRVDFYDICGKIYFGELTFFPGSGMIHYSPDEWDYRIGEWLKLPENM